MFFNLLLISQANYMLRRNRETGLYSFIATEIKQISNQFQLVPICVVNSV